MIINHIGIDVIHLPNAARSRRYRWKGSFFRRHIINRMTDADETIAPHHARDAGYTPSIIFRPARHSHTGTSGIRHFALINTRHSRPDKRRH